MITGRALISSFVTIILSAFVAVAHADDSSPATLTIGLAICLSGPCALSGENALHGATLAANDLNAKGGILGHRVEFKVEDTQDAITGARAISAYRALRRDSRIHFFIGSSWTPGLLALAPIVSREKEIIMISTEGGVREFHEAGPNLFNARGTDEAITRKLAQLAYASGARTAAIFASQQAWELAQSGFFEDEFKKCGGKILLKLEPLPTMTDLTAEALKIVSKKPDVILFGAYTQLDLALKAVHSLGYKGGKYISFVDDSHIKLSGVAIEGAITQNVLKLSPSFRERLKKSYPQTEPIWSAFTAYDVVMLYAHAINEAGSFEHSEVLKKLVVQEIDGMSGKFKFDGGRVAVREADIFQQVKGGELTEYVPHVLHADK